jgi:hypothetical protein
MHRKRDAFPVAHYFCHITWGKKVDPKVTNETTVDRYRALFPGWTSGASTRWDVLIMSQARVSEVAAQSAPG